MRQQVMNHNVIDIAGHMTFDYVCPLCVSKTKPLADDLFEHICSVLRREGTDVSESSAFSAIRLVSHELVRCSFLEAFCGLAVDHRISFCDLFGNTDAIAIALQ